MTKTALAALILLAASITYPHSTNAQGLQFEKGSWKEVVAKAKAEKKPIYLDVYTTWCGPCKMMAKKYFPDESIGRYYNSNFINYSIDAEKGEGITLAKQFNVTAYPTNLFIDSKAENVVFKATGCPMERSGFLKNGEYGIMEYNDPLPMEGYQKKYLSNAYDEKFLVSYIEKLNRRNERNDQILNSFMEKFAAKWKQDTLNDFLFTQVVGLNNKAALYLFQQKEFMEKMNTSSLREYRAFRLLENDIEYSLQKRNEEYFKQAHKQFVNLYPEAKFKAMQMNYEFYSQFKNKTKQWSSALAFGDFLMAAKPDYYMDNDAQEATDYKRKIDGEARNKSLKEDELKAFLEERLVKNTRYQHSFSAMAIQYLNDMSWFAFEQKRKDNWAIEKALAWSRKALSLGNYDGANVDAVQDTYNCLLYASGKKEEAIELEEALMNRVQKTDPEGAKVYEETLKKMKDSQL